MAAELEISRLTTDKIVLERQIDTLQEENRKLRETMRFMVDTRIPIPRPPPPKFLKKTVFNVNVWLVLDVARYSFFVCDD